MLDVKVKAGVKGRNKVRIKGHKDSGLLEEVIAEVTRGQGVTRGQEVITAAPSTSCTCLMVSVKVPCFMPIKIS